MKATIYIVFSIEVILKTITTTGKSKRMNKKNDEILNIKQMNSFEITCSNYMFKRN